jgi:acetyl-CoA carboxylase biotin carboxyl carrier protein
VSLTAKDIAEIARLLDESQFSSLDLTVGDFRLKIRRDGGWHARDEEEEELPSPPRKAVAPSTTPPPPIGQEAGAPRVGEIDVPAPLLGNFYTAPRPGQAPFVNVGDTVTEDSVIGIIEVMKLMNSVRAGVAGKVVAILAVDGSAVDEGQPLIRVRREG